MASNSSQIEGRSPVLQYGMQRTETRWLLRIGLGDCTGPQIGVATDSVRLLGLDSTQVFELHNRIAIISASSYIVSQSLCLRDSPLALLVTSCCEAFMCVRPRVVHL